MFCQDTLTSVEEVQTRSSRKKNTQEGTQRMTSSIWWGNVSGSTEARWRALLVWWPFACHPAVELSLSHFRAADLIRGVISSVYTPGPNVPHAFKREQQPVPPCPPHQKTSLFSVSFHPALVHTVAHKFILSNYLFGKFPPIHLSRSQTVTPGRCPGYFVLLVTGTKKTDWWEQMDGWMDGFVYLSLYILKHRFEEVFKLRLLVKLLGELSDMHS